MVHWAGGARELCVFHAIRNWCFAYPGQDGNALASVNERAPSAIRRPSCLDEPCPKGVGNGRTDPQAVSRLVLGGVVSIVESRTRRPSCEGERGSRQGRWNDDPSLRLG